MSSLQTSAVKDKKIELCCSVWYVDEFRLLTSDVIDHFFFRSSVNFGHVLFRRIFQE
jgi:hypothetical protein